MSDARLKRIARLLEVREGEAQSAQRAFADATRAAADEERRRDEAIKVWERRVAALLELRSVPAGDVAAEAAYVRTLRAGADAAEDALREALATAQARRAAVLEAQAVVRRIEAWRDRALEAARAEEARRDRRADDERAARTLRRQA